MPVLIGFVVGVAAGGAGIASWLLSQPDSASASVEGAAQNRVEELKTRFALAIAEGKRAGAETETEMRQRLESSRRSARQSAS